MEKIYTDKAPAAIGPYSQAVVAGNIVFTSGQIPVIPETGETDGSDIVTQTKRVCENLGQVLLASGSSFASVIKTTCYLADMSYFADFNSVYEEYFINKPARSCVAVKALPKNVLVEIDAVAVKE